MFFADIGSHFFNFSYTFPQGHVILYTAIIIITKYGQHQGWGQLQL